MQEQNLQLGFEALLLDSVGHFNWFNDIIVWALAAVAWFFGAVLSYEMLR